MVQDYFYYLTDLQLIDLRLSKLSSRNTLKLALPQKLMESRLKILNLMILRMAYILDDSNPLFGMNSESHAISDMPMKYNQLHKLLLG